MTVGQLRKRRSIVTGAIVATTVGLSAYFATQVHKGLPWDDETIVKAEFSNVSGLRVGDGVRIASVRVGTVKEIELVDGKPQVTMSLGKDRQVFRNAKAETRAAAVAARSVLGQKYVSLHPGAPVSGELGPEDVIAGTTRTTDAHDLGGLLDDVFDKPTRDAAGATLREVGGGARGHGQDFNDILRAAPEMLPDLGSVARALSADEGADTSAMLASAERLAERFVSRQRHITGVLRGLGSTLDAVGVDDGEPLVSALQQGPSTLRAARAGLRSLQAPLADLQAGMTTLRPGARAFGDATPDLRGVLREGLRPLGKMPAVNKQARPAVSDLTGVFKDARPLAPRTSQALHHSHRLLKVLAPYAPEVSDWFTNWAAALSHKDQNGHYLRLTLLFSEESFAGQGGVASPLVDRNPYPAPGEAARDRATLTPEGGK